MDSHKKSKPEREEQKIKATDFITEEKKNQTPEHLLGLRGRFNAASSASRATESRSADRKSEEQHFQNEQIELLQKKLDTKYNDTFQSRERGAKAALKSIFNLSNEKEKKFAMAELLAPIENLNAGDLSSKLQKLQELAFLVEKNIETWKKNNASRDYKSVADDKTNPKKDTFIKFFHTASNMIMDTRIALLDRRAQELLTQKDDAGFNKLMAEQTAEFKNEIRRAKDIPPGQKTDVVENEFKAKFEKHLSPIYQMGENAKLRSSIEPNPDSDKRPTTPTTKR